MKVMDEEGIDIALFYPSLGLDWESSCDDADLVAAHCRVYNDWLIDFCKTDPSRLVPVAHVSFMDVEQAVEETRRVAGLGAKGLMMLAFPPRNGQPYGEPVYDPIWAEAESLGLPVGIHVHGGGTRFGGDYFYPHPWKASWWWWFVTAGEFVIDSFTSMFQGGMFDRFPNLQVIALESGCGWLAYWLERMDEYFERYGFETPMQLGQAERVLPPAVLDFHGAEREDRADYDAIVGCRPVLVGVGLPAFGCGDGDGGAVEEEPGRSA